MVRSANEEKKKIDCHDLMNLVAAVLDRALTIGSPRCNSCLSPPLLLVVLIVSV